jgi:hypothetical protein
VLSGLLGDAQHFYRTPHKYVIVASKEVNELTFLFGFKLTPVWTVFALPSVSIYMALAALPTLKVPDKGGMARPVEADGSQRLSSLNSIAATVAAANLMQFCSQSSAR